MDEADFDFDHDSDSGSNSDSELGSDSINDDVVMEPVVRSDRPDRSDCSDRSVLSHIPVTGLSGDLSTFLGRKFTGSILRSTFTGPVPVIGIGIGTKTLTEFCFQCRTSKILDTKPAYKPEGWGDGCKSSLYSTLEENRSEKMEQEKEKKKKEMENRGTKRSFLEVTSDTLDEEIDEDKGDKEDNEDKKRLDPYTFLHGITETGHTVLVHLRGFKPYFYVAAFLKDKDKDPRQSVIQPWHIKRICDTVASKCKLEYGAVTGNLVFLKHVFEYTLCPDVDPEDINTPIQQPYLKMFFPSRDTLRHASNILKKYPLRIPGIYYTNSIFEVEEARVDAEQRFYDDSRVQPEAWVCLRACLVVPDDRRVGLTDYELEADMCDVVPVQREDTAPLLVGSFDIETNSVDGSFPNPERPNDVPYVICTSYAWFGSVPPYAASFVKLGVPVLRVCQVLKPCAVVPGVLIEVCGTESESLNRFADWAYRLMDIDILMQFNGDRFDVPFLCSRAGARTGCSVAPILDTNRFFYTSRIVDLRSVPSDKQLESKGLGESAKCVILTSHGRCSFDLLPWIRSNFKFNLYTLNALSHEMFKEGKHPIKPDDIFVTYSRGGEEDVAKIVAYCCQDCDLLHRICVEKSIFTQVMMFCRVMYTPMNTLVTSGQTVRVFNQIMHEAHLSGYIMNGLYSTKYVTDKSYGGGTVLDPTAGFYDDPVVVLDFSSLYPSIMIANNLCYSTIIDPGTDPAVLRACLDKGLVLKTFECANGTHKFVQNDAGIIGRVLRRLKEDRNAAKKIIEISKDPVIIDAMKKRESAIKVSMNSMYGATGAKLGRLPCQPIAESVTCEGGRMLRLCKLTAETEFGFPVVYGDTDSIMVLCVGKSMSEAFEFGQVAAKRLSSLFKNPIKMEIDKIFRKYLLVKKKMYTGLVFSTPTQYDAYIRGEVGIGDKNGPQHVTRGLKMSRRDNCSMLRELCNEIVTTLFSTGPKQAFEIAAEGLNRLVSNGYPLDKYAITMTTKRNYDVHHAAGPARCVAARFAIQPGERVPFIISARRDPSRLLKTGAKASTNKNGTLGEYARHPSEMSLIKTKGYDTPDRLYYLDKQLLQGLKVLFVGDLWPPVERLFNTARHAITSQQSGLVSIIKFCSTTKNGKEKEDKEGKEDKEEERIETPTIIAKKVEKKIKQSSISSFFIKKS
jgi:DNA polymerase delta subunit 1